MMKHTILWASLASFLPHADAWYGLTKTGWDCCKPACAWPNIIQQASARGAVKVCGKNDKPLSGYQALNEQSACADIGPGNGFLCSSFQPKPLTEDLSVGFAIMGELRDCCKCFELEWLNGPATGKRMQVQQINAGVQKNEIVIISPGGGTGSVQKGCQAQYGGVWGRQFGGVASAADCESLPDHMRGGCYWRWNWARGDVNEWPISVRNISCPQVLKDISGCDN